MNNKYLIAGAMIGATLFGAGCSEPDVRSVRGETPRQFAERVKEEHDLKTIGVGGLLRQKTFVLQEMKQEATDAAQDASIAAEKARNDQQDNAITGLTEIAATHTKAIKSNTAAIKVNTEKVNGLENRVGRVETRLGPDASNPSRLGFYEESMLTLGGDAWDNYVKALDFVGKKPEVAADGRPEAKLTKDDLKRIEVFQTFYNDLANDVRAGACKADITSKDVKSYVASLEGKKVPATREDGSVVRNADGKVVMEDALNTQRVANYKKLAEHLDRGTIDVAALAGVEGRLVQQVTDTYNNVGEFTRLQSLHEDLVRAYGEEAGIRVADVDGQPAYSISQEDLANARKAGIEVSGLTDARYIDVEAMPRRNTTVEFIAAGEAQEKLAKQLHKDENYSAMEPNSGIYTVEINGIDRKVMFGSHSMSGVEYNKAKAMDKNADGFVSFKEAVDAEQGRNMKLSAGVPASTTLEKEVTAGNYSTQ